MVFLHVVFVILGLTFSAVACGVGTYMLEVILEDETDGIMPSLVGFSGVILGCFAAGAIVIAGWPFWTIPLLAPIAAVVASALLALLTVGLGYVVVHGMRSIMRHSRSAALALREKVRDYRFHRNLDQ
jgi:hypothetical protein